MQLAAWGAHETKHGMGLACATSGRGKEDSENNADSEDNGNSVEDRHEAREDSRDSIQKMTDGREYGIEDRCDGSEYGIEDSYKHQNRESH